MINDPVGAVVAAKALVSERVSDADAPAETCTILAREREREDIVDAVASSSLPVGRSNAARAGDDANKSLPVGRDNDTFGADEA